MRHCSLVVTTLVAISGLPLSSESSKDIGYLLSFLTIKRLSLPHPTTACLQLLRSVLPRHMITELIFDFEGTVLPEVDADFHLVDIFNTVI